MTAESPTWNIERVWSTTTEAKTEELGTLELSRFRGVVMLGAAGAGKTTEAARLADQERRAGASVHSCRLAEFAESSTELRQHLAKRSRGANERTVLYLDALDEAMIPARRRWLAIKRWVTEDLAGTGASIRITCRSAVWPSELTQVIHELVGSQSFATAALQPLSDEDIHSAAASQGIARRCLPRADSRLRGPKSRRPTPFPPHVDAIAPVQPRTTCFPEGSLPERPRTARVRTPSTVARSTPRILFHRPSCSKRLNAWPAT